MEDSGGRRRLAAVWFADVVGYTRLSAENEDAALQVVSELQRVARTEVERRDGRVVKFIGDAVLTVFDSADAALHAALAMQDGFAASEVVQAHGVALRVGVHLGEVMEAEDGDVYGDGVNVASRVEGAAEPGQVAVTSAIHNVIRNRPGFAAASLGAKPLKGVADPVELYAVTLAGRKARGGRRRMATKKPGGQRPARATAVGIGTAVVSFLSLSIFVAQKAGPDDPAPPDTVVVSTPVQDSTTLMKAPAPAAERTASEEPTPVVTGAVTPDTGAEKEPATPPAPPETLPPATATPAIGWRVEEGQDLLDDSPFTSLSLTATQGIPATLHVECRGGRTTVRLEWPDRLVDSGLRVRLDGGRDRDERSQWTLLPDSSGVSYRGDPRRFIRSLESARSWVAAARTRSGQGVAGFRVEGLGETVGSAGGGCGWR